MVQMLKVYKVSTTIDEYGRIGETVGYFAVQSQAEKASKGMGYYGSNGEVKQLNAIKVEGQIYVIEAGPIRLGVDLIRERSDKRDAALAKLTDEEKQILGIRE